MSETLTQEPSQDISHDAPPELERVLAMRRDELRPDVRSYADNLHEQILAVFAEHGAQNFTEFERIAREKELPISLLEHVQKLVGRLLEIVERGEVFYRVTVDYDQPLLDMVAAGHYDDIDPNLRSKFEKLTTRSWSGLGRVTRDIIITIDENTTADETTTIHNVLKDFHRRGLRPVDIAELLALGAQYPELQREFVIAELGKVLVVDGANALVVLYHSGDKRTIGFDLAGYTGSWNRHGVHFAAVVAEEEKNRLHF